jgi:hypothetical protein
MYGVASNNNNVGENTAMILVTMDRIWVANRIS